MKKPRPVSPDPYKRTKERVNRIIKQWKPRLGLHNWWIRIEWFEGSLELDASAIATCEPAWQYNEMRLRICLPKMAAIQEPQAFEEVIIHELLHAYTIPVLDADKNGDDGKLIMEWVTSSLTRIVYDLVENTDHQTSKRDALKELGQELGRFN